VTWDGGHSAPNFRKPRIGQTAEDKLSKEAESSLAIRQACEKGQRKATDKEKRRSSRKYWGSEKGCIGAGQGGQNRNFMGGRSEGTRQFAKDGKGACRTSPSQGALTAELGHIYNWDKGGRGLVVRSLTVTRWIKGRYFERAKRRTTSCSIGRCGNFQRHTLWEKRLGQMPFAVRKERKGKQGMREILPRGKRPNGSN